jgi:hypothetical protein
MNRRNFFKAFGSAILGTAIMLKIPEILVPTLKEEKLNYNPNAISYSMLMAQYDLLKAHPYSDARIYNLSPINYTKTTYGQIYRELTKD